MHGVVVLIFYHCTVYTFTHQFKTKNQLHCLLIQRCVIYHEAVVITDTAAQLTFRNTNHIEQQMQARLTNNTILPVNFSPFNSCTGVRIRSFQPHLSNLWDAT